ncbi:7012_t:CDS:2 [Racocetra fulgida]|uniref:7012_t:CDS:1 n=1 Tax=Racocetra fulgida TaxID=60492 RepID=A0A9N8VZZ3_9GLOM|nr:7012_t:CDS:2 [Racocetra fulgida]
MELKFDEIKKKNKSDEYNDELQSKRKKKRPLYPIHTQAVFTLQESSESATNSTVDENQILLEEDNEDNDCEVLDDETISIQAPQVVQNSPHIIGRGRQFKCRFMNSIEKKQN